MVKKLQGHCQGVGSSISGEGQIIKIACEHGGVHKAGSNWLLHFHRKSSLYCFVGSVNSVLKFLGQPGETRFQPGGDEISSGVPMTFNTKLTEPKGK